MEALVLLLQRSTLGARRNCAGIKFPPNLRSCRGFKLGGIFRACVHGSLLANVR